MVAILDDDDENPRPVYSYTGERAPGGTTDITAGEAPKVLTKSVALLGNRHGAGKASYPNGDTYVGEWDKGLRDGKGTYTYAAKLAEGDEPKPPIRVYEGAWSAGLKKGLGIETWAAGHKYHGSYKDGLFHGQGTFFFAVCAARRGSQLLTGGHLLDRLSEKQLCAREIARCDSLSARGPARSPPDHRQITARSPPDHGQITARCRRECGFMFARPSCAVTQSVRLLTPSMCCATRSTTYTN